MFPRSKGIDKKIGDIATIIDEQQLGAATGPMPLDDGAAAQAETTLRDETITAIQTLKDISQALIEGASPEEQVRLGRKLMLMRQTIRMLARAHFEPGSAPKKK